MYFVPCEMRLKKKLFQCYKRNLKSQLNELKYKIIPGKIQVSEQRGNYDRDRAIQTGRNLYVYI